MRRPSLILLTLGILAAFSTRPISLYGGQSEAVGQAAARRQGKMAAQPTDRDLDVRLATAKLELTKAELAVAERANERAPGAVSDSQMERLKSGVQHASSRLAEAQASVNPELELKYARASAGVADAELQVSLQANEKVPGAVTKIDIERLRLVALAAHLYVEKLEAAESRAADVQSELTELRKEVTALRKSVEELSRKTGAAAPNK